MWSRVGRGGKNWFLPLVPTGLNRLAESNSGKNCKKKTKRTKAVGFLVSSGSKCTKMCLEIIGMYSAFCFIGFLVDSCLKCVYPYISYYYWDMLLCLKNCKNCIVA